MDERSRRSALLSALTTEHFVLQTANNSTYSEASASSTLYVMALSSSLVAMGFLSHSTDMLILFSATVLPAVFCLESSPLFGSSKRRWKACTIWTELPAFEVITVLSVRTQSATSRRSCYCPCRLRGLCQKGPRRDQGSGGTRFSFYESARQPNRC